jgi:MoaA/NifB/PqqE/SkfB family radical SAM enzyme
MMDQLAQYLSDGVESTLRQALKASLTNPRESAFLLKYLLTSAAAAKKREAAQETGASVPPFLIASIASTCNLFCSGCYARANSTVGASACAAQLSDSDWARIFREARELGVTFILLAGGEPLMRRGVLEAAAGTPQIIFPVFTNGTMFDEAYLDLFDRSRNLVPVISVEGDAAQTNARRGAGVYEKLAAAMEAISERGILFGVSVTVTKENLKTVTERPYIDALRARGCRLAIFVEYVPVNGTSASAPDDADRAELLRRIDGMRAELDDFILIAFPGDEDALGGCLAAGRGFFHISPRGDAEPCPFSPFSDTNLKESSLRDALASPLFRTLKLGGFLEGEHAGGCTLYEKEARIRALMQAQKE